MDDTAPTPASSQTILGTACPDDRVNRSEAAGGKWFYSRGKGACPGVHMHDFTDEGHYKAYQVVYNFQVQLTRFFSIFFAIFYNPIITQRSRAATCNLY